MSAVFKVESHNHPSFIEPFQGAATGVGGILRDIFTMGARPVANLNSLRFGDVEGDSDTAKYQKHLVRGVCRRDWKLWKLYGSSNNWWRNQF